MGRKLKLDIRKAHTKKAKLAKKFKLDIRKGCRGSVEYCCPTHVHCAAQLVSEDRNGRLSWADK